ncbi:MAG: glycosyltransferase [Nitrospirota bacterium]|jgi:hypothetical protein
MKTVHIIGARERISDYCLTPVRQNRRELHDMGYDVSIYYDLKEKNLCCDILCLLSKATLALLGMMRQDVHPVYSEPNPVISLLRKARKHTSKIIWMDDSDSTGVTHFELLPYVDRYLKKQLLRDRRLYEKEFYGGRIWSDFYHAEFGIEDSPVFSQFYPLDEKYWGKVGLSWNIGLGNMYDSYTLKGRLQHRLADYWQFNYKMPFADASSRRKTDLFVRMTTDYRRESLAFHRNEVARILRQLSTGGRINIPPDMRLPFKEYNKMLADCKVAVSPFGWGELCVRDWSAFIFGACLLKPTMHHLETWPDIFVEGETYYPFKWDFSDFESTICQLLDDDAKRTRIAANGQRAYVDSISPAGMGKFRDRFIEQIEA